MSIVSATEQLNPIKQHSIHTDRFRLGFDRRAHVVSPERSPTVLVRVARELRPAIFYRSARRLTVTEPYRPTELSRGYDGHKKLAGSEFRP